MLKVLVIDDEKLVRQMIMRCIDWESIGFQIAGEASSARMGLKMVDELHPDLVCMDVRMPGTDGLSCSRQILERYPDMKILILSGHGEFEYASEGIRIGVFDYLLKPINAQELYQAVCKAKEAILEEQGHQEELAHVKEALDRHSGYIKDKQLSALVHSEAPEQYLDSLAYFGVEFHNDLFQVALVEMVPEEGELHREEKDLLKMQTRKIAEDYYGDMRGMFVFDNGADWIVLLNNESESAIYGCEEELKQYLENNTGAKGYIGAGNIYTGMENIRLSYREAENAVSEQIREDEKNREEAQCLSDREKSLVHKIRDYVDAHYSEEALSLKSVANSYYVNPSYLSRVFKEKTGHTFSGYLLEIRMKEAKRLVAHTELRAYEIAERIGISDPHYFSSCFKKYTGMSVSEYRRKG